MPKYTVRISKIKAPFRNPFKPLNINAVACGESRVFEMEAKDENQIRMFFDEAQKEGHPNVKGFEISHIQKR